MPLYENIPIGGDERIHKLSAAYSDDDGETWQLGSRVSYDDIEGWGTEAQIAERHDSTLLMSARNQDGGVGRIFSTSDDGGASWSTARFDTTLKTPPCMSSLVAVDEGPGKTVLFHTVPNTEDARESGQLYRSVDGGATWIHDQPIYPGEFAYSALVVLKDGQLGCLYEADHYKSIRYVVLDVK